MLCTRDKLYVKILNLILTSLSSFETSAKKKTIFFLMWLQSTKTKAFISLVLESAGASCALVIRIGFYTY